MESLVARTSSTNPPYAETVSKYIKETNADPAFVAAEIAKYASSLAMENLDFVAWHWVKKQGLAPPPLNTAPPFTSLQVPYVTMAEGLKVGANTGFTIRGYYIGGKLGVTGKGTDMYIMNMLDESGVHDLLVFGDKVKVANEFVKSLTPLDKIRLTGVSTFGGDKNKSPVLSGGDYTNFQKVVNDPNNDLKIPQVTAVPPTPLKQLEIFESALVRGLGYSYEIQPYVGCPNCKSKFRDNQQADRPAECNDRDIKGGGKKKGCGIVTAKNLVFTTLVIVDNKFDVKLKFNPDMVVPEATLKDITDNLKPVWAIGSLQKNDTFRVDWYEIEEKLRSGPISGPNTGTGLPSGTTIAPTPAVPTTTSIPPTPTASIPVPVTVTATPQGMTVTTGTVSTQPTAMIASAELQRVIDEELMEYMNIFQGTANVPEVLDFLKRRNISEDNGKLIILEAVMQKKITKDGNTIRKVAR